MDVTTDGLLEREAEIDALSEVLEGPSAGRGRLVVVEGSAGTGKSSLLRAAVASARRSGLDVLRSRGGEMERDQPFGLIRQLLEPALLRLDPAARAALSSGAAAPAARVLAIDSEAAPVSDGFGAVNAVFWLVAGLAARGPLLIAGDDAHWGDVSSLSALEHLARRIEDLGVVLLITLRPAEPGAPGALLDALRQVPGAVHLDPAPLSAAAVSTLLRSRWPEVPDAVSLAAHDVTAGNPLLFTELLRTLPARETPTPQAVISASLPTLEERVLRRAARVAPEAPALAQAIAILGDGVRLRTAAELAGIDAGQATTLAHGLAQIEVLAGEDPAAFVHPVVRRSIYDGIPAAERHQMHTRAAELLLAQGATPEVAVAHLTVLPPAGSVAVATLHLRAAEAALGRGAPAEAVAWLERAIAEQAPEPPRGVLLARLGLTRASLRDPGCVEILQEAYDTLDDTDLKRAVVVELAYGLAVSGAWERSAALMARAERDLADDAASVSDLAAIRATLALHDARRGADFDRRRVALRRIADTGDDWGSAGVAAILGSEAAYRGQVALAREELTLARRGERLLRERGAAGWAVPMLLGLPIMLDDLESAAQLIHDAEAATRTSGSVLGMLFALVSKAWLRARRGDLIGAEVDLTTLLTLSQDAGYAMLIANISLYLIDVLLEREGAAAAAAAIENIPAPTEFRATWSGAMLIEARGRLRLARGAREEAVADLRDAGQTATALRFGPVISGWRSALALAVARESPEEAVALATEELALARETGLPRPQGVALRTLGILGGREDVAIENLHASVAMLAHGPSQLEHARSLVALGGALRRGNQSREARAALSSGLDLAISCGAERLREEAEAELLAAGGRRRRGNQQGIESLTASELRVARLAASELTNLEIAQALFVSVKTVETHLAHVYGKLGLAGSGSRWRLAGLLGDIFEETDASVPIRKSRVGVRQRGPR